MTLHSRKFSPARSRAVFAALAAAALTVAGCGAETGDTGSSAEPEAASTTTSAASSTAPASTSVAAEDTTEADTKDVSAAAASAGGQSATPFTLEDTHLQNPGNPELQIEDVRAGTHEDVDRVVVELSGTGTPNVLAGYTADPRQQASGLPLVPAGNAYFELIIQGVPWSMGLSDADLAKADPAGVAAGGIQEIADGGIFEADAQYIVGLNAQRPYNLYLLENPTRVVVDFRK
ncbi:AMIN-like domain-containing (lipo)protein [Corynebacterium pilbarense]